MKPQLFLAFLSYAIYSPVDNRITSIVICPCQTINKYAINQTAIALGCQFYPQVSHPMGAGMIFLVPLITFCSLIFLVPPNLVSSIW